jgi:glycosyltransferase involved in cell wall biosynthesis
MDILFLLQLPPPVHGASLVNDSLVRSRLLRDAFSIRVFPLRFASSIRDIGSFSLRKIALMLATLCRLTVELLTHRPRLVYFTLSPVGNAFLRDVLFVALLKLFRVRILYHLHGKGIAAAAAHSTVSRRLYRFVFRGSRVIVLAESLAEDLAGVYEGRPFVVNNGIEPAVGTGGIRRPTGAAPQLLYLSNLAREKGVLVFVEALAILVQRGVDFRADIVGSDFDVTAKGLAEFLRERGLAEKVAVTGPRYGEDKFLAMAAADVFCFPTFYRNEAFPLVILEAMQSGLAIVSTYEGAIPDIIDQGVNGLLVPQQQAPALADALARLLADERLRRELGSRAREKFLARYTREIFEKNMRSVFTTALG